MKLLVTFLNFSEQLIYYKRKIDKKGWGHKLYTESHVFFSMRGVCEIIYSKLALHSSQTRINVGIQITVAFNLL